MLQKYRKNPKFLYFPFCSKIWLSPLMDDGQPTTLTNLEGGNKKERKKNLTLFLPPWKEAPL